MHTCVLNWYTENITGCVSGSTESIFRHPQSYTESTCSTSAETDSEYISHFNNRIHSYVRDVVLKLAERGYHVLPKRLGHPEDGIPQHGRPQCDLAYFIWQTSNNNVQLWLNIFLYSKSIDLFIYFNLGHLPSKSCGMMFNCIRQSYICCHHYVGH